MDAQSVRHAIVGLKRLPPLPTSLARVFETLTDPNSSARDVAERISADQSLCAAILKLVNSAFYGFPRRITNIADAIAILGFLEVRNLVLASTAFGVMPSSGSTYDRTQLWRHAIAVAMLTERIGKAIGAAPDQGHFVCGLLHDIGKVVLDTTFPKEFDKAAKQAKEEHLFLWEAELRVFGLHHGEVGGLLAEKWQMPLSVVAAIQYHHQLEQCGEQTELTCSVGLADYLAYESGLGESATARPPLLPEFAIRRLAFSQDQQTRLRAEMQQLSDRVDVLLGALPGNP